MRGDVELQVGVRHKEPLARVPVTTVDARAVEGPLAGDAPRDEGATTVPRPTRPGRIIQPRTREAPRNVARPAAYDERRVRPRHPLLCDELEQVRQQRLAIGREEALVNETGEGIRHRLCGPSDLAGDWPHAGHHRVMKQPHGDVEAYARQRTARLPRGVLQWLERGLNHEPVSSNRQRTPGVEERGAALTKNRAGIVSDTTTCDQLV